MLLKTNYEPSRIHILNIVMLVFNTLRAQPMLDLGRPNLLHQLQIKGQQYSTEGFIPSTVPINLLFVQHRVAGKFPLVTRLHAQLLARALTELALGE